MTCSERDVEWIYVIYLMHFLAAFQLNYVFTVDIGNCDIGGDS